MFGGEIGSYVPGGGSILLCSEVRLVAMYLEVGVYYYVLERNRFLLCNYIDITVTLQSKYSLRRSPVLLGETFTMF
jgi:hypothetical protein